MGIYRISLASPVSHVFPISKKKGDNSPWVTYDDVHHPFPSL